MFKKPYISGISGTGISNIAYYFLEKGVKIYGSDGRKTDFMEKLENLGSEIFYTQTAENIQKVQPDAFFYSQAIEDGSGKVELEEAKKLGIPTFKNAEGYFELFKDKKIIAISGAHGKTTTTALASVIFTAGGLDPTCIIGAPIKEFANKNFPEGRSFKLGNGDFVIIEADEYRRNFLALKKIFGLVILNIEHDHPDCYKDIDDVKNAFLELAKNVDKKGFLLISESQKTLFENLKNQKFYFGEKSDWDTHFEIVKPSEIEKIKFQISKQDDLDDDFVDFAEKEKNFFNTFCHSKIRSSVFQFPKSLIGEKNDLNILAAIASYFLIILKFRKFKNEVFKSEKDFRNWSKFDEIGNALKNFSGTYRRQELIGFLKKQV
ncbi:MAG: hypothetical protein Fur0024_3830 [Patescibacteria group bacterium]